MQVPLEFSQRGLTRNQVRHVRQEIDHWLEKLDRLGDGLVSCRIAIEREGRHGCPYRVRIEATVPPHHDLVATRNASDGEPTDPAEFAMRETFRMLERQLKPVLERRRGDVKVHHPPEDLAFVERIFADRDYGFLRTVSGQEIYFHRNSVTHGDYERLTVGTQVRYVAVSDEDDGALRASTVQILDKPGVRATEDEAQNNEMPMGWES